MTEEDLRGAIDRIGRTADGELLYLWLQKRLLRVIHSTEAGTLRTENGQRTLASELMGLLSTGLAEVHAGTRSERTIVFTVAKPVSVRDSGGARRRGIPNDPDYRPEFDPDSPGAA
jgi:hypothetical protein